MPDTRVTPHARLSLGSVYAVCGFIVALVVHVATFTPYSMSPANPFFWILHLGIFPIFIPTVLGLRRWSDVRSGFLGFKTSRLRRREILAFLPKWSVRAAALLFAYTFINFALSSGHLPSGNHGSTSIPLDPEQARYLVRAFSGHWLFFYAVPAIYFLCLIGISARVLVVEPRLAATGVVILLTGWPLFRLSRAIVGRGRGSKQT